MNNILFWLFLIYLLDRLLILRKRYRIAIESNMPHKYGRGYFAIWIYCKGAQDENYMRDGGKKLFYFHFGKQLKK